MMRRGVVYTIVALLLLLVVYSVFTTQSRRTAADSAQSTADRVHNVNLFLQNLGKDSERAAYIAGFRSFIAMEQHIASNGHFFNDTGAAFKEAFLQGSVENTSYLIMQNSSFGEYLQRVRVAAASEGITFNATVVDVRLWQIEPWHVLVNYTLEINVTDLRGTASWQATRTFVGAVPITDLRDPLFTNGTLGRIQRVVRQTNVSQFVDDTGDANDTTQLMAHFNNSYYAAMGRGPSMLMRFSGNLSDSPFGIESLVDTDELTTQGLTVDSGVSVVDYEYFTAIPATACGVQNIPSEMKFTDNDLEVYGIEGALTYAPCP
jgi:hypothetical protein